MSSSSSVALPNVTSITPGTASVLLFWAEWHEASSGEVNEVVATLSRMFPSIFFGRVEAEACGELSGRLGVTVIPTLCLLDASGNLVEKLDGIRDVAEITQAVKRLANRVESSSTDGTLLDAVPSKEKKEEESLNDKLGRLINSQQVMLFMKGTPEAPRCGFSRQAVEILREQQIRFGSFDILGDEDVRQGLKSYSDWPTYPQIYAKGELVGGLDIVKEMVQDESCGTLAEQLGVNQEPAQSSLNDRLEALTKKHRIMLFMKGLPSAPQCGFSRQAVDLLEKYGANYDSFNILQDQDVREGLKRYSDWPTYPQLYVEGDLIGGLDIMKEMDDSNELGELLKG